MSRGGFRFAVLRFALIDNPDRSPELMREFGPRFRLRHRREFLRFFGKREVFRLSECVVFRIPNELGHFRLGITLKARGSSVDRNAVKRAVRESFRELGPSLGAHDYNVVVPREKSLSFPYPERLKNSVLRELSDAL